MLQHALQNARLYYCAGPRNAVTYMALLLCGRECCKIHGFIIARHLGNAIKYTALLLPGNAAANCPHSGKLHAERQTAHPAANCTPQRQMGETLTGLISRARDLYVGYAKR